MSRDDGDPRARDLRQIMFQSLDPVAKDALKRVLATRGVDVDALTGEGFPAPGGIPNDYFEVPVHPSAPFLCSDNQCPCPGAERLSPGDNGYIFISAEVVSERKDARAWADCLRKQERMAHELQSSLFFDAGIFVPIFLCEQAARRRHLDLETAAADARNWVATGLCPLRPTPRRREGIAPRNEIRQRAVEGHTQPTRLERRCPSCNLPLRNVPDQVLCSACRSRAENVAVQDPTTSQPTSDPRETARSEERRRSANLANQLLGATCPECGVRMKRQNVKKHLRKAHARPSSPQGWKDAQGLPLRNLAPAQRDPSAISAEQDVETPDHDSRDPQPLGRRTHRAVRAQRFRDLLGRLWGRVSLWTK